MLKVKFKSHNHDPEFRNKTDIMALSFTTCKNYILFVISQNNCTCKNTLISFTTTISIEFEFTFRGRHPMNQGR